MEENYMTLPILDPNFKPAIIELRKFNEDVAKCENKQHLIIAVERNNGYVYRKELDIFADGIDDERNVFIVERLIKSILWIVGGYKIYISGSEVVYNKIKSFYTDGGFRDFDYHFMSNVYENEVCVVNSNLDYLNGFKAAIAHFFETNAIIVKLEQI